MIIGNRKWVELTLERNSYFLVWGLEIWFLNSYHIEFNKYHYKHTQAFHEAFVKANFTENEAEKILRGECP